jgi:hypothetical protein
MGGAFGRDGRIVGGSIMLDDEYDRTSGMRRLLRIHELGHALGYHHVESRISIMNPRIGAEPTVVDRDVARLAFRRTTDDAGGRTAERGLTGAARVSPETGRLSARP